MSERQDALDRPERAGDTAGATSGPGLVTSVRR